MVETVLITGGAGFIGCHVAARLLRAGYRVRVLDSFIEQVHPPGARRNAILSETELVVGDVRDAVAVRRALRGADKLIHLAAEVGVGQSMYAIDRYVSVNDLGTAVLFQALTEHRVERVVVASSMSIYGEGLYETDLGQRVEDAVRTREGASWDLVGANGETLHPLPTPESKRPNLASVYALTKYVQERLCLTVAAAYGMQRSRCDYSTSTGRARPCRTRILAACHLRLAVAEWRAPRGVRRRPATPRFRACRRCRARLSPGTHIFQC